MGPGNGRLLAPLRAPSGRSARDHPGDERARTRRLRLARDTAVDYSTPQQLITTAWNVLLALVLVVSVFGWKGGKQLVTQSYEDAKVKVAEQKEAHAEKKAAKQAARDASNNNAEEVPSSSAREGERDA